VSERRHVDPEQAALGGEAAGQARDEPGFPVPGERPDRRRPDEAVYGDGSPTYYDQPVIKEPVWIWSVPAYFYAGGVAAGAALVGAVAQLTDRQGLDGLVRRSRWLAAAGTALGTGFLIHDLGRPARFLNMLRVFRPSSAMSLGSWTLAASGTASGASAVLPLVGGAPGRVLGDVAGLGAGAIAPVLGTYTAVLVADTAVPVWKAAHTSLPPFFAASSLMAATAALDLLGDDDARERSITRRLGTAAKVADLAAGELVERDVDRVERVGRPLHEGASGALWRAGKACTAASLAVSFAPVPARWRRARDIAAAVLGSAGALTARFGVFHAGAASARDPRATFHQQRAPLATTSGDPSS
jgi:hypothetical protein